MGVALAVRQDKKINLDDIERDNLKSERKVKQEAKTITSTTYVQQQQQQQATPQYAYIQQAPPQTYYQQEVLPQTAYVQQTPSQYNFLPVKTAQHYAQQQSNSVAAPQLYGRFPQYEVPDNSITQQQSNYYYTGQQQPQQQYVYLQSAAAQQAEPRATVQYVMYIPAPAATSPAAAYVASPKTETLLQSAQEYLNALPLPQTYATQEYATYDVAADPTPQRLVSGLNIVALKPCVNVVL